MWDVEDSLKSNDLLKYTSLQLMPACKSNGWSLFRFSTPHAKQKDAPAVCAQKLGDCEERFPLIRLCTQKFVINKLALARKHVDAQKIQNLKCTIEPELVV